MKKLLVLVVLFAAFSFNSTEAVAEVKKKSCMELAWDFGTDYDGHDAYYWTNYYYSQYC